MLFASPIVCVIVAFHARSGNMSLAGNDVPTAIIIKGRVVKIVRHTILIRVRCTIFIGN